MVHVFISLFPVVLFALKAQWQADYATLGAVYMAATMAYGAGAVPVGHLLNRVRPVTVIRIFLVSASLAALAVALAPNETFFAVALFLLGVACSLYHVASLTFITRAGHNDSRLLARWAMSGNAGLALTPVIGGVLAWLISWRLPFAVVGALGLVIATTLLRTMPPIDDRPSEEERQRAAGQRSLHAPALTLVYAMGIALGIVSTAFLTFLPAYVGTRTSFLPTSSTLVAGGALASLVYLAGIFGQGWAGRIADRRTGELIYAGTAALNGVLLIGVFFASGWLLVLALGAFSFFHFATQPMDNVMTGRYTAPWVRGAVFGWSCLLVLGLGSLGAWLGGLVADATSGRLQYVFLAMSGIAFVAAGLGIALHVVGRDHDARALGWEGGGEQIQ